MKHEKSKGKELPSYAWPGGYPVMYIEEGTERVLCPDCVNSQGDQSLMYDSFIHYEGGPITCDECNKNIDSAYGPTDDLDGRPEPKECPTCGSSDGFSLVNGSWECNVCECLVYD